MLEVKYVPVKRGRTALQAAVPSLSTKPVKDGQEWGQVLTFCCAKRLVPQLMSEVRILLT